MTDNPCRCGAPLPQGAVLCNRCADNLREQLHKIADRWPDLEIALGATESGGEKGRTKNGMRAVGTVINEGAVKARRACTDAVWFMVQVLRDDLDSAGREFTPPPTSKNRSQDDTPTLARWLADWHVSHFTHRTSDETAWEVAKDVEAAEEATFDALKDRARKIPTGMPCEQHGTSDMGERVPCPGVMEAALTDHMPDLVCSEDRSHRIPPDVWSRQYWKRSHITEAGARRLVDKMRS